jgi:hypothetical protein
MEGVYVGNFIDNFGSKKSNGSAISLKFPIYDTRSLRIVEFVILE